MPPEEIRVAIVTRLEPTTVGGHDVGREEVVAGSAELGHQDPESAA